MAYKDKEKQKEYNRKYYEANKERIAEQQQQYYEANKEHIAERIQQQYNTPLGRAKKMTNVLKRIDEKAGRGECTITPKWMMENIFASKCYYCGETDWKKLGCDRIDNTLPHTPENVVCACGACNKKRGTLSFKEFLERLKSGETFLKKNVPDQSKPVIAQNDAGEVVYEFPSTKEAGRNGFGQGNVSNACNGCYLRDGNHQYKGLWWYWA